MFSYAFACTIMSDILYQNKASIQRKIHLKEKLQKPFYFFKMSDSAVFGLLTCWLKYYMVLSCGGIGQFNCDNRSQQHVEAIYESFDFIGPTRTS